MTDDESGVINSPDGDREQAERRYVAALIALDAAAEPSPTVATTAAAAATDVVRLNDTWYQDGLRPGDPSPAGLFTRIVAELARLLPWRRRRLQGAMIAAINRNAEATRALIDATQHFQSHVVWYAQTIAAYAAASRHTGSPVSVAALHTAINNLGTDWLTHWESLATREQRTTARIEALTHAYGELKDLAVLTQKGTLSLKRTVEQASTAGAATPVSMPRPGFATDTPPFGFDTNAYKYVGFEDRFRGPREEIRERMRPYLALFAGATNVLDAGCGRGELLDLFREQGIDARGIDLNEAMVALCRERGLHVERADVLSYLAAQPDDSLGGLIATQVVEHLEPEYLMRFLETARLKLKPGAVLVLETINPACWAAFFDGYIRDLTHARPLHPDTLKYLVQASGYQSVDVRFLSPVADAEKLPTIHAAPAPSDQLPAIVELIDTVNAHADRLNARLFSFRDYAVIARS
jgi:SAM-dependent methyltransferase